MRARQPSQSSEDAYPRYHTMHLETIEVLALTGEGAAGAQHWSRNVERPRYSLNSVEAKQASFTHSFTCFDVAERVEVDYDIVFAGRVSYHDSYPLGCERQVLCVLHGVLKTS